MYFARKLLRMCNLPHNAYKQVPHDADFIKALLAKPCVKKAYDALEQDYSKLFARTMNNIRKKLKTELRPIASHSSH